MWKTGVALVFCAAAVTAAAANVACFKASAWPEADALFLDDPNWVGADGAFSIDLGNDRALWLFGDTWIDPTGGHSRQGAKMIRNSVAIQTGTNPSDASIRFHWGQSDDGDPKAVFAAADDEWFWPGHGIRLGDRLIIFLNRLRATDTSLGFASAGWNAVMIENPDGAPSEWRMRMLETPSNPLGILVGFAGVLQWQDYLYAFGSQDPVKSHPIFVARWPAQKVEDGDLSDPQWWGGKDVGWVADSASSPRWPVFENGQSELTLHFDKATGQFVAVQTLGFGKSDIFIRTADGLTGPWTRPKTIYSPPEIARPNVMIYAAKAHPQVTGADLVLTYANNSFEFQDHFTDSNIYYPRFVQLTRCGKH